MITEKQSQRLVKAVKELGHTEYEALKVLAKVIAIEVEEQKKKGATSAKK